MVAFSKREMRLAAMLLAAPAALAAIDIDGRNIPTDFANGSLLATQRFMTQFGNDDDQGQFGGGSELDQLFADNDGTYLYIGLSGNLQNSGNAVVIFLDVNGPTTGMNTLVTKDFNNDPVPGLRDDNAPEGGQIFGRPRYLAGSPDFCSGLHGITFDTGFAADYALGFSGGSPLGSQTRSYYLVNWTTLDPAGGEGSTNEVAGMMTAGIANASGSNGTLGSFLSTSNLGIRGAADNSNADGVEGGSAVSEIANTATKGFEFAIPLSLLGVGEGDSVCFFAMVCGDNGYMSNQFLPTSDIDPELLNLACGPFDFNFLAGTQFACYEITSGGGCPNGGGTGNFCTADITGDCQVGLSDLSLLLSTFGLSAGDPGFVAAADFNGNGSVGLEDLAFLLGQFGDICS
ncbi:MAG: hypothetical protein IT450_23630 [Phycisphaerales bacterium]|nr:hypothetical protein [Phycisphaerales bacterium]